MLPIGLIMGLFLEQLGTDQLFLMITTSISVLLEMMKITNESLSCLNSLCLIQFNFTLRIMDTQDSISSSIKTCSSIASSRPNKTQMFIWPVLTYIFMIQIPKEKLITIQVTLQLQD